MDRLKEDVKEKFEKAKETFPTAAEGSEDPENAESLQLFAFICELAFDVFLKKQMIERLADELRDAKSCSDSAFSGSSDPSAAVGKVSFA